jgi:NADPH2:quinone reductase
MRAIVVPKFGSAEVLELQEVPAPTPGPNDLLVEVKACALNPIDFKVRGGALAKGRPFPIILGFDLSGVVRETGKEVSTFRAGDEIYASPSLIRNGANAELVCLDARTAALKPKSLDHLQAAALPLVTITAWEALFLRARVQRGETILIHAGGGGVGHVAIQIAKLQGCRVLTTASSPESMELCRRLGADLVINYREADFVQVVQTETNRQGCPIVFDTVGGETFDRSLDCVAVDGRLITCVGSPSDRIPQRLFRINASLYFQFMGAPGVYGVRLESQGEILHAAAALVDEGKLKPHIGRVLTLEQVPEGHRLLESGHVTGKLGVRVSEQ